MQHERLTRQGVRDLNPKGHNARSAACPCHRNPEIPTRVELHIRPVTTQTPLGTITSDQAVGVHMCAFCGRERFSEHDED